MATVRVPDVLRIRLASVATARGTTADNLAEEAIRAFLRDLPREGPRASPVRSLPRRAEPRAAVQPERAVAAATQRAALEDRIRAAYLRVTGGPINEYVKLAQLRAELGDEPADAVDAELRKMQQRGGAVLYAIDDPRRLRPEDDAAAIRVSGERRDLLCIKR